MRLTLLLLLIAIAAVSSNQLFSIKDITSKIEARLSGFKKIKSEFTTFLTHLKIKLLPTKLPLNLQGMYADLDPDVYRSSIEVMMSKGYPVESHYILTQDRYILMAWRIRKNVTHKYPVMLQHGLLDCSFSWIMNMANQSLPYILADAGYDVWMTNNRGNRYSQTHSVYTQKSNYKEFWSFSWDEMAKYDVPANVEYIKKTAGVDKVHYIGHSQGTTQWFAHHATNIDSQVNFKSFVGLGPVMYIQHVGGVFSYSVIIELLYEFLNFLGLGELMTMPGDSSALLGEVCNYGSYVCENVIKLICGFTEGANFNTTRVPVMSSHEPGGASLRTLHHWIQMIGKPGFPFYDFGKESNMKVYGQAVSPQYPVENLQKLDIPLLLVQGGKDVLVADDDFAGLLKVLPSKKRQSIIKKDWNHLDYLWAMDANVEIYPKIVSFLADAEAQKKLKNFLSK